MQVATDPYEWEAPLPLSSHTAKPWPRGRFPEPFESFVVGLSDATETPLELAALMMLSAVATAVQGSFIVRPKQDYSEPVNLWTCVVLPSGNRKSAVQTACTAPLTDWEKKQAPVASEEILRQQSVNRTIEARVKRLRSQAAKSSSKDLDALTSEITELEKRLVDLPQPPQLWTSDVTPENLGIMMAAQNERMAVLSDEGGIFDILASRYSGGMPNLDLALQAHAGSPCRVNRVNRPPVQLNCPCLTMGLSPQPEVLQGLARQSVFRGRGLLARFLYACPESKVGYRTLDTPPLNSCTKTEYSEAIRLLVETSRPTSQKPVNVAELTLSPDSSATWQAFSHVVEDGMRDGSTYAHIRDWASKLPGAILRISALLHLMETFRNPGSLTQVENAQMEKAVNIGFTLMSHALAAFDLMGNDTSKTGAMKVLDWLKKLGAYRFARRECHYALKSTFRKVADLQPCLDLLEEYGYIKLRDPNGGPGRPSVEYSVTPWLNKEEKETG